MGNHVLKVALYEWVQVFKTFTSGSFLVALLEREVVSMLSDQVAQWGFIFSP